MDQLVCLWGASTSVYKGAKGGGWPAKEEGAGGVLLLPGVGLPSRFLVQLGERGREEKGGRRPSLLVQFGLGGRAAPPPSFSPLFPCLDSYS